MFAHRTPSHSPNEFSQQNLPNEDFTDPFFALFLGIPLGNIITSGQVVPAIGYVSSILGILTFIVALMILTVRFSRRR